MRAGLLVVLLLIAGLAGAQNGAESAPTHISDEGGWFEVNLGKKLSNNWSLSLVHQHRRTNFFERYHHAFWVLGGAKQIGERSSFGGGYVYLHNQPLDLDGLSTTVYEHRGFQFFKTSRVVRNVTLTHRSQLEERFLNTTTYPTSAENSKNEVHSFALRGRFYFGASYPLTNQLSITAFEELFFQTDFETPLFLEQNRAGALVKYQLSNHVAVSAGYMNWTLFTNGLPKRSVTNHTITTALIIRLD